VAQITTQINAENYNSQFTIHNHWCPVKTQSNHIIAFEINYEPILSTI